MAAVRVGFSVPCFNKQIPFYYEVDQVAKFQSWQYKLEEFVVS